MPSLKINLSVLKRFINKLEDPAFRNYANRLPQEKGIAALIGQAIADNFEKEGPGWPPLRAQTIRDSATKKNQKALAEMTDKQIYQHEQKARLAQANDPYGRGEIQPFRRILQRTGLLKKTVTTPNFIGSKKNVTGSNIYQVEGNNIIWGTDLFYAGIHNKGDPARHVPKREYLVIRPEWKQKIYQYCIDGFMRRISQILEEGR